MEMNSELDKSETNQNYDAEPSIKKRGVELGAVLRNQSLALKEFINVVPRKFHLKTIEIPTIGGEPIKLKTWASTEPRHLKKNEKKTEIVCLVCGRVFDEKRKLLNHARYHKPKDNGKRKDDDEKDLTQSEGDN
ncbi:hypothetical protein EDEG_02186 [Edhazardia aedis USNM 41457]|uniref:C2H2-type domain-containing protein n=1 Tax=Edhazardia aedis (strain USNM 41457) TaxID=1003232 RepID=J9DLM5_EDHAE|nr:hypothetical protein EDEG_02186 [Edhazardia aedis USNM 41457]|eukprot:EJW03490.1 hypothetical protein EDEG_02186 [Edhazardia aedis USNM 41457]